MTRLNSRVRKQLPGDFDSLVKVLPPTAIHDEVAYGNAMEVVDALSSLPKLTKGQAEYLDTLSILVEAYEDDHDGFDESEVSPLDAIRALLRENDMTCSDLGRLLGDRALGSKILGGQRELSKAHIRKLAGRFGVSTDLFF
jgi:antitoxin component HigA of HigAB toxin-antitoxin module